MDETYLWYNQPSGLAVVGALLGKSDFAKKLNRMDVTKDFIKRLSGLSEASLQKIHSVSEWMTSETASGRYRCYTDG